MMCHSIFAKSNKLVSKALTAFITILFYSNVFAQGNLLVTPKRVVFEGTKRSEELNLANTGTDTATFVISFIQIRMKDDGTFEKISQPDSAQNFADKYIRFFPRTVTLGPNEAQTVKMQVIKTNEMSPGEYRSHLYFRAMPVERPLGDKPAETNDSSISVKLVPIFGISMPVIIRVGQNDSKVSLSDVSFKMEDTIPAMDMTFHRSGNMSVYGDISVDHISDNGKVTHVGVVKGMAVYTPNTTRRYHLKLEKNGINYHSGKLHLVYTDQSVKPVTLAEDEIVLR